jgi:serine/threonine-protein kinase RsbW
MKKTPHSKSEKMPSHPPRVRPTQEFHLECKSDPKEIGKVEPFLQKVNGVARLDDGTFYRLLVAGTEAVNNGIIHGNKLDPHKLVYVTCVLEDSCFTFRVKDQGRGFRPEEVPDPLEEKNLLKTSGRGIFLMRSLMDKVNFRITSEGTEVELVIDLTHLG